MEKIHFTLNTKIRINFIISIILQILFSFFFSNLLNISYVVWKIILTLYTNRCWDTGLCVSFLCVVYVLYHTVMVWRIRGVCKYAAQRLYETHFKLIDGYRYNFYYKFSHSINLHCSFQCYHETWQRLVM